MGHVRNCLLPLIAVALLGACKKNPIDRLANPLAGGSVPQTSGTYNIYCEELETGGNFGFFPGGENQTMELGDTSSPRRTTKAMRYAWNGGDVVVNSTTTEHDFAGFSLVVSPGLTSLNSYPAKDLSAAGYTRLKLFARGSLASDTTLRIEGPDDGDGGRTADRFESPLDFPTLTNDWQEISLVISTASFSSVKVFLTVSFQYAQPSGTTTPSEGSVVYLDDIRYVKE